MNTLILLAGLTVGGCDAPCDNLPCVAPIRRTVCFFVEHKPLRTFFKTHKPVRRLLRCIVRPRCCRRR